MTYSESRTRLLRGLTIAAAVLFVIGLYLALFWVGPERQQGAAQRIFYVHLGSFLGAFIAFGATVAAGIAYLRTRDPRWDTFGLANVEIGLGMAAITIVTGMAWARPIWNTWWTWEPRLTSVAIMWLAYAAYLMLRSGIEDPDRRARFGAVYAIVGFISVPLTFFSARLFRTIHPVVIGTNQPGAEGAFDMTADMRLVFFFSLFTFSVIFVDLLWHRIRLGQLQDQVEQLKLKFNV